MLGCANSSIPTSWLQVNPPLPSPTLESAGEDEDDDDDDMEPGKLLNQC